MKYRRGFFKIVQSCAYLKFFKIQAKCQSYRGAPEILPYFNALLSRA